MVERLVYTEKVAGSIPVGTMTKMTDENYERFLIKEFEHWKLYLHQNQAYLGRCYLWARREADVSLAGATTEEFLELRVLSQGIESVLGNLFNPNFFEYHQMGNEAPHLHVHIVPRYKSSRRV